MHRSSSALRPLLKRAVKSNDVAAVEALVADLIVLGEPIDTCSGYKTLLSIAARKGHFECAILLLPFSRDVAHALMAAADAAQVDLVKLLMPHCDPKAHHPDRFDMTPLMLAAFRGSAECVEALLLASDPFAVSQWGNTALTWGSMDHPCPGKTKSKVQRCADIINSHAHRMAMAEAYIIERCIQPASAPQRSARSL